MGDHFFKRMHQRQRFREGGDVMPGGTRFLRGTKVSGGGSVAMLPNGGRTSALSPSGPIAVALELRTLV